MSIPVNGYENIQIRITEYERATIKSLAKKHFGEEADIYIFGSRADVNKRGGDIDLYITAEIASSKIIRKRISLLIDLEKAIGEQKIDIIVNNQTRQKPIYEIARKQGVKL